MISDFPVLGPHADLFHPVWPGADHTLTETVYFNFHIPEENLIGQVYAWFHPTLKVCSAGVWIWRGFCRELLAASYVDYRSFLPYPTTDLGDCRLANGMHFKVLVPLHQYQFNYEDPTQGLKLHFVSTGTVPPVSRSHALDFEADAKSASSGGLEQPMKVEGSLSLKGRTYQIDCYKVRDRSWGQIRPETPMPIPPMGWAACAFGPDFSFGAMAYDQAESMTELKDVLKLPEPGKELVQGWVQRDGEVRRIVRSRKRTERRQLIPIANQIELEDSTGRVFNIRTEIVSSIPVSIWPNITIHWALAKFECEGLTGYGESQDVQWSPYISHYLQS